MSRAAWTLLRRLFFLATIAAGLCDLSSNPWAISCSSQAVLEDFSEKNFTHRPAVGNSYGIHFPGDAFRSQRIGKSGTRCVRTPQEQE
jgi:hypothetical protein